MALTDAAIKKAVVVRQTRRDILDLLNLTYPTGIRFGTIAESFIEVDESYLRRDLAWLEENKLIRWRHYLGEKYTKPGVAMKDRLFVLTADGESLVTGIAADPHPDLES